MFNKCKIEFRKLDHNDIINDIKLSLKTITPDNCQKFYNHTNKFINMYKLNSN